MDGADARRGARDDAGAAPFAAERAGQFRDFRSGDADGIVEEPDRRDCHSDGGHCFGVPGDWRRGDYERHASDGDGADAGNRHSQGAGSATRRYPDAIFD